MNDKLRVENLVKIIDKRKVLNGVTFRVKEGETLSIIGPNGAGKSTLLKCIDLLVMPDSGRIFFNDIEITSAKNIEKMRTKIGFVFQESSLFTHMKIIDNVLIGLLKVKKLERMEAERIARYALEQVGLEKEKWSKYPLQLSGGERQRAAIARALAMEPELILYDEPTSNLDPLGAYDVFKTIEKLSRIGITSIIATHDPRVIYKVSRRVILLFNGKVVAELTPQEISVKKNSFENPVIRMFLESLSLPLNNGLG